MLYLVIAHQLSTEELQRARIPDGPDQGPMKLSEAFAIVVPKRSPSFGKYRSGRSSTRVDFPAEAAHWLRPLLERFEQRRQQYIKKDMNRHVFVVPHRARWDTRAGRGYFQACVRRASQRVLGMTCNINTLRKTSAVFWTDIGGPGMIKNMGWSGEHAFVYMWAERQIVVPQPMAAEVSIELGGTDPVIYPSPLQSDPQIENK